MKEALPHGAFLPWIEAEFGMSRFTADRFMNTAEQFGDKCSSVQHLPPTVLYALAAPSTPDEVRTNVVQMATAGEKLTPGRAATSEAGGGAQSAAKNVIVERRRSADL